MNIEFKYHESLGQLHDLKFFVSRYASTANGRYLHLNDNGNTGWSVLYGAQLIPERKAFEGLRFHRDPGQPMPTAVIFDAEGTTFRIKEIKTHAVAHKFFHIEIGDDSLAVIHHSQHFRNISALERIIAGGARG